MANATIKYSKRLDVLPPYLFAQIDTLKAEKEAQGIDVMILEWGPRSANAAPYRRFARARRAQRCEPSGTPPLKVCYRLERP